MLQVNYVSLQGVKASESGALCARFQLLEPYRQLLHLYTQIVGPFCRELLACNY